MNYKKFAAEIERKACMQVIRNSEPVSKFNFNSWLITTLAGVLILLVASILLFSGAWVPAIWQLTSIVWVVWRGFLVLK